MKNIEWWRSTATHMWRTYFAICRDGMNNLSDPEKKIFDICNPVFQNDFIKSDQAVLQMYYTSRWGDDKFAVESYSFHHNIPVDTIWMIIRRANRTVMENVGLLEKKNDIQERSCLQS